LIKIKMTGNMITEENLPEHQFWRLNRIQYPVYSLGPGKRIGIWVQGCSLKCRNCISSDLWNFNGGKEISLQYLAAQIFNISASFDGITVTGGEPFDQYFSLLNFCRIIKKLTDLNIMIYSGYTIEEIADNQMSEIFSQIDFLMDGRFETAQHSSDHMRGSRNQKFYVFHCGKPSFCSEDFSNAPWSVKTAEDGTVYLAGIPGPGEISEIELDLKKRGMRVEFQ